MESGTSFGECVVCVCVCACGVCVLMCVCVCVDWMKGLGPPCVGADFLWLIVTLTFAVLAYQEQIV